MLYELIDNSKCHLIYVDQEKEPEKWHELRKTGIGGSDVGAIMGMNKYSTPLSVYMAKKDLSNFAGNAATMWGHILEDPIRQQTAKELDVHIETVPGMFRSNKCEFMNANVDGLVMVEGDKEIAGEVVNGLGGHEIKTSSTGEGFALDEIPDSYYCQVQHYMNVLGLDWFLLSVFILGSKTGKHYIIRRNDEFIEHMVEEETDFWENYVLMDRAPAPTGNDNESELIKSLPMPAEVELPDECMDMLEEKQRLDLEISLLKAKSEAIKESLLMKMNELGSGENSDKTIAICGPWKITYNTQIRKMVDSDALKKDGLYDTYSKESISKVMRISGGK